MKERSSASFRCRERVQLRVTTASSETSWTVRLAKGFILQ